MWYAMSFVHVHLLINSMHQSVDYEGTLFSEGKGGKKQYGENNKLL